MRFRGPLLVIALAFAMAPASASARVYPAGQYEGTNGAGFKASFSLVYVPNRYSGALYPEGRDLQVRRPSCESDACASLRVGQFQFDRYARVPTATLQALSADRYPYGIQIELGDRGMYFAVYTYPQTVLLREQDPAIPADTDRFKMQLQEPGTAGAAVVADAGPRASAAGGGLASIAAPRTEYVAQLDSICQSYERPAGKLFKRFAAGTRGLLKDQIEGDVADTEGRLLRAFGGLLDGGTELLLRMDAQISAIPPPLGDEATIAAWLQGRASYARIAKSAARAARREHANRTLILLGKAGEALAGGEQLVASFGFQQCA